MENHIVILDRYIDSSLAYQGVARNLGIENILKFHEYSPLNILPNLTFYLSISMETSMRRQQARGSEKDYFEKENTEFYQKLIDGFNSCVNIFPKRIETIDASLDIKSVSTAIQRAFEKRINNNE
jgi:dTMP kinase